MTDKEKAELLNLRKRVETQREEIKKEYIEREAVCYQLEKQETIDGQPRAIRRARRNGARGRNRASVTRWEILLWR